MAISKLKALRECLGLSREECAEMLSLSLQAIVSYESSPKLSRGFRLYEAFLEREVALKGIVFDPKKERYVKHKDGKSHFRNAFDFGLEVGALYNFRKILAPASSDNILESLDPKARKNNHDCLFRYEGQQKNFYVFRSYLGGYSMTLTRSQLVGRVPKKVNLEE